jgi:hypothetical protein
MNNKSSLFMTGLAGALVLAGGACAGKPLQETGSGGTPGAGGGSTSGVGGVGASGAGGGGASGTGGGGVVGFIPLPSSPTGFVQDATSGVIGAWYAYGDGIGPGASAAGDDHSNSDCVAKGGFPPSDCSQILSPVAGMPFVPADAATSAMCTSGTAAVVMNMGSSPDYSDLWGAGIGLDFNNPGGDAGVRGYLDLSAYKGIYFQFYTFPASTTDPISNGAGPPSMGMRVNFPSLGQHGSDAPYWRGAMTIASPLTSPGGAVTENMVLWTDVAGPFYLNQQNPPVTPPVFDPAAVQAIQFQVFTNTSSPTPYSFCVANLALIPK